MTKLTLGYPGVCKDYEGPIFALYSEGYSYRYISMWLRDNEKVVISPESISKYIKKNYLHSDTPGLTGVVEAPRPKVEDLTDSTKESEILESLGLDPQKYFINGVKSWGKGELNENANFSYDVRLRPDTPPDTEDNFDLATVFAEAKRAHNLRKPVASPNNRTATVVVWADPQTGKVDKLGGVEEQTDRIYNIYDQLANYISQNPAEKALFLDAGDGVEGFENTGSQMFTNQLSLMDQIDLEASYEQDYIKLLAHNHREVEVHGIDSNHCKWRSGKSNLGLPKDDWGRFIKRQLAKAFDMNPEMYSHVSFNEPDDWERTLSIDVFGRKIGLTHGDQVNSIDAMPKWWAGQVHGGLALSDVELLITGHFHHFLLRQTGRLPNGATKYHLGAPTLDNGSSWYEGQSGESSDPGLIVFQFDQNNGFNFDSLTMLKEKK